MPFSRYLPEHMGSASLTPSGPFVAGTHAEFTLVYTAGTFGIDDTGMLKISWRTTSDMAKPQFTDPAAANYTSVVASNGAKLEYWIERLNIRPWVNTLLIRVGRGFLRAGDTIAVRFGDRRGGSPGLRLQTNCEEHFSLKVYVDAFATYEFTELPVSPDFALVAGEAARFKAILPSLAVAGEPFRLAIVAEDIWGNPTAIGRTLTLASSMPIKESTRHDHGGDGPAVLENLVVDAEGDVELRVTDESGSELARANPLRVAARAPLRRYWGDLHGQSGETVGTNPARSYFAYARDKAFVDIVGHQGNDFQITDAFWHELNGSDRRVRRAGPLRLRAGLRVVRQHRHGRRPQHLLPPRRPADLPLLAHPGRGSVQRRLLHRAGPVHCAARSRMQSSSRMSAGATPTSRWRMTVGSNVPSKCTPPGARSSGCCMTRSTRAIASASSATATTTRAGPARRGRAHRPSGRSAGSPAT